MDRRQFLMGSAAALGAASSVIRRAQRHGAHRRASASAAVAHDHISGYSNLPNVEIAAICDIDDSHIANGPETDCKAWASPSRKPTPTSASCWKTSPSTRSPSPRPTTGTRCMTIWALPGRQGRVRRKALLAQYFRSQADCGGGAQVQPHGAAGQPDPLLGGGPGSRAEDARRADRRRLHGARAVLQVARHHRPRRRSNRCPPAWITTCGPALRPMHQFTQEPFPLQLALVLGHRQRRPGQPGHPRDGHRALGPGREVSR